MCCGCTCAAVYGVRYYKKNKHLLTSLDKGDDKKKTKHQMKLQMQTMPMHVMKTESTDIDESVDGHTTTNIVEEVDSDDDDDDKMKVKLNPMVMMKSKSHSKYSSVSGNEDEEDAD